MKYFFLLMGCLFLTSACSTFEYYNSKNKTENGIKFSKGVKDNIHINDKIFVLERKCRDNGRVQLCKTTNVGNMTVKEVAEEYSVIVPDQNMVFREGYYFEFATHCETGDSEICKVKNIDTQ